jgi:hypothetical protein
MSLKRPHLTSEKAFPCNFLRYLVRSQLKKGNNPLMVSVAIISFCATQVYDRQTDRQTDNRFAKRQNWANVMGLQNSF